jgi:NADH-quinone oxidoreductase subunit L
MSTSALIVLFAPVAGFVVQYFFGRRLPRQGDLFTVAAIGVSLTWSIVILLKVLGEGTGYVYLSDAWTWMTPGGAGSAPWTMGIQIDGLTAVMLFVVALVAFLVHVFSIGYMHGDPKYPLFFAWLQLFSASMLLLVLASNLLMLFMGWELVGLCSYKLIGFWSEKPAPANAARKAFITTRIGDLGILVALMAVHAAVGSFDFGAIQEAVRDGTFGGPWLTVAGLGVLFGAMGKSAQFPLHVWLPDAMEGPTPVSALIHAATMVAAGVYLVGRMTFMLTPDVLFVVGAVGAVTAFMAGFIALAQDDIKKVLAYSTVSQLGYMFLGLGVGAWHAALFHLTTHAFFKALMFLGSGSVIHACHHEQDMRRMGGLWRKLPLTGTTFLVGVLAIAGLPFLSGFYSKDAILSGAYHRFPVLFWIGLAAAVMTAFYMTRLFVMTFLGRPRDGHVHEHAHEGGFSMKMPLVVLAALSVVAGWGTWHTTLLAPPTDVTFEVARTVETRTPRLEAAGQPLLDDRGRPIEVVATQVVREAVPTVGDVEHFEHSGAVMAMAVAAGLGGLLFGWVVFSLGAVYLEKLKRPVRFLEAACTNKFWFDELYREVVLRPAYAAASLFALVDAKGVDGLVNAVGRGGIATSVASGLHDAIVVDGAVNDVGAVCQAGGAAVSRTQSGRIRFYLSLSVGAVAVVLVLIRIL